MFFPEATVAVSKGSSWILPCSLKEGGGGDLIRLVRTLLLIPKDQIKLGSCCRPSQAETVPIPEVQPRLDNPPRAFSQRDTPAAESAGKSMKKQQLRGVLHLRC